MDTINKVKEVLNGIKEDTKEMRAAAVTMIRDSSTGFDDTVRNDITGFTAES